MKKFLRIAFLAFFVFTLSLVCVGCGGNTEPPVENEYEYEFSIGKGEHKVDLAYVVKTSYASRDDITSYTVYYKVGNKMMTDSVAMSTFSGKDGLLQIGAIELRLEDDALSYVSGKGDDFVPQYSSLAGTYQLNESSTLSQDDRYEGMDFSLVLNADGTGEFIDEPLVFYPISSTTIILVADADQYNGLFVNLAEDNTFSLNNDSLSFNFTIGAKMEDFYKVYFDNHANFKTGGGIFKHSSIYYNDTHFYIYGDEWTMGSYEIKEGNIMVLHNIYAEAEGDATSPEIVLYDDCFDFDRAKVYAGTNGDLYYYKNGMAYASLNYDYFSKNCSIPKGMEGVDVPAIYVPERDTTYVFDKETFETLYTVDGDTYIDPKDFTVYNDICDQPNAEPHVNILVSEDKTEAFFESIYPSENRVVYIKYDNMQLVLNNSAVMLNGEFYFFIEEDKYVHVPYYSVSILTSKWSSVTEFEIVRGVSVSHKHYSTENTDSDYTADNVYFLTAEWDDSVIYFSLDFYQVPGADYLTYDIYTFENNTLLAEYAPGTNVLFTENNHLAIIKKTGEKVSFVCFEDIEGSGIRYIDTDDGFITVYEPNEKYYYLIGEESLEIEYMIKDDDYAGLKDARFIKPAGIDSVTIKEQHYYNQQTFSDLIVVGNKLYKPTSCNYYYKCTIYEAYDCEFPKLMAGEVIEYNVTRYDDELSDYVTEPYYYYVNEEGYYALNDIREWLDPAGLANFTLVEGSVKTYSANHTGYDGEDMILETAKYKDANGTEYMLILGYALFDCYDFGNYIEDSAMTMYTLACGTCVESEDGFTLYTAKGTYTVTIDGETATLTYTAN